VDAALPSQLSLMDPQVSGIQEGRKIDRVHIQFAGMTRFLGVAILGWHNWVPRIGRRRPDWMAFLEAEAHPGRYGGVL
jgi:hypothetical protein